MRKAKIERKTNETELIVEIELDGTGESDIQTGIGFFDHMLTQIAVHGLFDLKITAHGDLEVDPHHTVEDTGLVLGAAINEALGEKRGITRVASALVPMDEALGQAVIDLSGRPYAVIEIEWSSPEVGGLPTTLVEHFFESLAISSSSNIHLRVHYGRDNHHIAESAFKSLARAMADATRVEPRRAERTQSSKGVL
jgi:imidazoleglycerol-phosphate dehydratase